MLGGPRNGPARDGAALRRHRVGHPGHGVTVLLHIVLQHCGVDLYARRGGRAFHHRARLGFLLPQPFQLEPASGK